MWKRAISGSGGGGITIGKVYPSETWSRGAHFTKNVSDLGVKPQCFSIVISPSIAFYCYDGENLDSVQNGTVIHNWATVTITDTSIEVNDYYTSTGDVTCALVVFG